MDWKKDEMGIGVADMRFSVMQMQIYELPRDRHRDRERVLREMEVVLVAMVEASLSVNVGV